MTTAIKTKKGIKKPQTDTAKAPLEAIRGLDIEAAKCSIKAKATSDKAKKRQYEERARRCRERAEGIFFLSMGDGDLSVLQRSASIPETVRFYQLNAKRAKEICKAETDPFSKKRWEERARKYESLSKATDTLFGKRSIEYR